MLSRSDQLGESKSGMYESLLSPGQIQGMHNVEMASAPL